MSFTIEDRFKIPENEAVVDFILRNGTLSAHDEVAEVLTRSAEGLADVKWYCPDVHRYAYVVLHTGRHRIFGIAFGQRTLAYRLPQQRQAEAVAAGAQPCGDIGHDWMIFDPWKDAGKPLDTRDWCKRAYEYVGKG